MICTRLPPTYRVSFSPTHFLGAAWLAALILWTMMVLAQPAAAAEENDDLAVRQLWQLLDYVAVDYGGAVSDGEVVDAAEFQEMREFTTNVRERVNSLPTREGRSALSAQSVALEDAVANRASSEEVSRLARTLADQLLASYPVALAPTAPPDHARGTALYQEHCASCHGASGHGDGPTAAALDPKPIAFTDRARASERSLLSLYESLSQGVPGTSMPGFAALSQEDRWALAFYVGEFAYPADAQREGERLWTRDSTARNRIRSIEALSRATEAEIAADLGESRAHALMAYLRATPSALSLPGGLGLAQTRLQQSVRAYASNDAKGALRLALSAYLDGVEPIEPQLSARDPALLRRVEAAMAEYRAAIGRDASAADVAAQGRNVGQLLDDAQAALDQAKLGAVTAFVGSFAILLREGLEALLIVIAIVAFLRKAGRQDVMRYVHGGWIAALLAGALTWMVATFLVDISGSGRELTEGYSSLFAALVLLSTGLWMHQKSIAGRWQRYIDQRLRQILNGRSAWLLTGLAFLVVYREVFETILFYAALARDGNGAAILGGLLAAAAALALIAAALLRFSARLPIGTFFSVSSVLIAVLAVVLAGKGAAALQEAGVLSVQTIAFPRVSLLGIFPTLQTLLLQLAVALAATAGFVYNARSARREQDASRS